MDMPVKSAESPDLFVNATQQFERTLTWVDGIKEGSIDFRINPKRTLENQQWSLEKIETLLNEKKNSANATKPAPTRATRHRRCGTPRSYSRSIPLQRSSCSGISGRSQSRSSTRSRIPVDGAT